MVKRIDENKAMPFLRSMNSFDLIVKEISEIRHRKNIDYGSAFLKFYDDFGMMGVLCDLGRKYGRIQNFAKGKELRVSDETIEDTLKDMAIISLNAVYWLRNKRKKLEASE